MHKFIFISSEKPTNMEVIFQKFPFVYCCFISWRLFWSIYVWDFNTFIVKKSFIPICFHVRWSYKNFPDACTFIDIEINKWKGIFRYSYLKERGRDCDDLNKVSSHGYCYNEKKTKFLNGKTYFFPAQSHQHINEP